MKEMKHENLVQFFGVCVEPPNVCLVMQYCRKGSLKVSLSGRPHGNAFVCKRMCFWNLVSGWKHLKTPPLCSHADSESAYFVYRWRHRPTPRPLYPTTSHNNNNNNGGLHACVRLSEDIEPIRVIRSKYSAALLLRWATKGLRKTDFVFCFFFHCLYTARKLYAHAPSLLLRFWWLSSATYRLEYKLQRVETFTMDPFGCKCSWNEVQFGTSGQGLSLKCMLTHL